MSPSDTTDAASLEALLAFTRHCGDLLAFLGDTWQGKVWLCCAGLWGILLFLAPLELIAIGWRLRRMEARQKREAVKP